MMADHLAPCCLPLVVSFVVMRHHQLDPVVGEGALLSTYLTSVVHSASLCYVKIGYAILQERFTCLTYKVLSKDLDVSNLRIVKLIVIKHVRRP